MAFPHNEQSRFTANTTRKGGGSPEVGRLGRHGLEHPEERSEFARFCLLSHYGRNSSFVSRLEELASSHQRTLDAIARQSLARGITELSDYRVAWGILSFLAKNPAPGTATHPLKVAIDSYRSELRTFCGEWGLAADWCAPSLHLALLGPRAYMGNFDDPSRVRALAPLFCWDLQWQGRPPYETLTTLPRLLLRSDAPGRQVDMRLLTHAGEDVWYDPRMDRWDDSLARARNLLGKKRLSSALKQDLLRRRREIEGAFAAARYTARRKPRQLGGHHALARWTYWTYLAICPPRLTTSQIVDRITAHRNDPDKIKLPQVVDRGIKEILKLLGLPPRPVRPT